ncbi:MAG: CoA transferase [Deltaproteobacteria bacterium]|nr:CoA transferase [Deltaproteobacteria bacterium]
MVKENIKKKALEGFRVLDLSRVLAGPYCAMILGDLGAEIIKIERPGYGDDTRSLGPFIGSESMYFMNTNRNKKSITLDLKSNAGKQVFLDLVKQSDVVLENYKPGVMEKLGIGHDKLKEYNSDIIYASISGFGHKSPYASRAGYDIIAQAMGGLMSCTGWPDSPPTRIGTAMGDILSGLFATIGILSALLARKSVTGSQHIDIALVDSVISSMNTMIQVYLVEGTVPGRVGNRYLFMYPFDTFKANDGWVVIGIGNDKLWHKFCDIVGWTEIEYAEKFSSNSNRVDNYKELEVLVTEWTKNKTVEEIIELLSSEGIPCSPVYDVRDIVNDDKIVIDRKMLVDVDHPKVGRTKLVGSPIKMSLTEPTIDKPAPLLGQHTRDILTSVLGYSEETIKNLRDRQAF